MYLLEGDLLLPCPSWVSYAPQAKLLRKNIILIQTSDKNDYCLRAEELEQACAGLDKNKQKLLIINNPNNPTGTIYNKQTITEISEICRANNIIILSDEIYAHLTFTNDEYDGFAHAYPEKTIVTGGLSKLFSAGGYRLGIAMIPEDFKLLKKALQVLISETYSCVSAPIQFAALAAYRDFSKLKNHIQNCRTLHHSACRYLYERLTQMKLSVPKPQGGFYLFPSFTHYREQLANKNISNNDELTQDLLKNAHIATLSGSDFNAPNDKLCMRIAAVDYDGAHVLDAFSSGKDVKNNIENYMPNLHNGCNRLEEYLSRL